MKTYLIHSQTIGGHQLEYLHHLYLGALERPSDRFFFAVPSRFTIDSAKLEWPEAEHIQILVMNPEDEVPSDCGLLSKGWRNSKTIRKYVRQYHVTDVVVITLMEYLPFLPLFLHRRVRVCGIIYRIYLYEWQHESRLMRWQDAFKYFLLSRFRVFHRVLMCNDSVSAHYLNRLFHTTKFRYMPDPVGALQGYAGRSIREELGISQSDKVFLHPGSMNCYKNTLGILRALYSMDRSDLQNMVFIFAGQVKKDIKEDFEFLYKKVNTKVHLVLLEGYLPFEKMADLFETCDYVLIPYLAKGQSSGIVGHAVYYGKPVIVVGKGVIGKIVRKWRLGHLLRDSSEGSICWILRYLMNNTPEYSMKREDYLTGHSIEKFNHAIYE
ncbi:Glycosyltransferase involved in cell wall bisynthesis [Prevotella sp. ne3005]|uniref:glycosyltransferase n=1 Tax=Prevotella sp. ne3005 TaxID=1761887 RepID=UPI0008D2CF4F|nr:glycosyltransferase [Prevotella sp. ne3005]SEM55696.1 Glycosyltransferase involved in cell wall bisynthesis [Prevotella sp. ne3005]